MSNKKFRHRVKTCIKAYCSTCFGNASVRNAMARNAYVSQARWKPHLEAFLSRQDDGSTFPARGRNSGCNTDEIRIAFVIDAY